MPLFQFMQRNDLGSCCLAVLLALLSLGCRSTVPVHVWQAGEVQTPKNAKVALAPMAGPPDLARRIEFHMLQQRPAAKSDVALFTSEQLAARSPVRLASTAALSTDLTALQAAKAVDAEILLQGEILSADLETTASDSFQPNLPENMNQKFFTMGQESEEKHESLLLSWRVIDTQSGRTLGKRMLTLRTDQALQQYPDLAGTIEDRTEVLLAASAREAWKTLAPVVVKDTVRLSKPFLQPGAIGVRLGIRAAKAGQWQLAEERWQRVADWFPYSAAAQHNLAIAKAAREDFPSAKEQLRKATGLFAWRLPGDTLFWLDKQHREYNEAHGIPRPLEGWAFPEPESAPEAIAAEPLDLEDLPWWTAIPFAKPPGWSWQSWLKQPLPL
jgi:hypothetical protein